MVDIGRREDRLLEKISELVRERDLAYYERDEALKEVARLMNRIDNPANVRI